MSDTAVIEYLDEIEVNVRDGALVHVALTPQGPQGPRGEKGPTGDVTPELMQARNDAVAAAQAAATSETNVIAYEDSAEQSKLQAATFASNASNSASAALQHKEDADAILAAAQIIKTNIDTAKADTEAAAGAAATSEANAATSAGASAASANIAAQAKADSETARDRAATSAQDSSDAADQSSAARDKAQEYRDQAAIHKDSAAASAADASGFTAQAHQAKLDAEAARDTVNNAIADVLSTSEKGAANGVAPLDADAKIPAVYLPSFVDDVVEADSYGDLPASGEKGKIYVTVDDNKTYRWGGSSYVNIASAPGTTDDVVEGSANRYFSEARVLATVLAGFSTSASAAITDADTVISAFGKTQAQIVSINNALTGKANAVHQHAIGDVTGLQSALDGKANVSHTHAIADITGLQTALNSKQANIGYTPVNKAGDEITFLSTWGTSGIFNGTADGASYAEYNIAFKGWNGMGMLAFDGSVNGFYDFRAGKWDVKGGFFKNGVEASYVGHGHSIADVSGLTEALAEKQTGLGFTPVQQGGGAGQETNKVYIGWSAGSKLLLQIDSTDFGANWPININGTASGSVSKTGDVMSGDLSFTSGVKIQAGDGNIVFRGDMQTQFGDYLSTALAARALKDSPVFTGIVNMLGDALEIGRVDGTASTPYIDFHAGATPTDYDVRILASSPTGTAGQGTLNITAAGLVCSGDITAFSDERLKTEVEVIENALDMIARIRGVRYTKDGHRGMGVIAQEVQRVAPELVFENDDEMRTLSVAYGNMTAILIQAVKELRDEVEKLKEAR